MAKVIDVELARLELASPDLLVVQLKADVKVTVPRVLEILQARRTMATGLPVGMLVITPGEVDWNADVLGMDFFSPEADRIKALAVMVNGGVLSAMVNLYFGLFPGRCPVNIVDSLDEGYTWLAHRGFGMARA